MLVITEDGYMHVCKLTGPAIYAISFFHFVYKHL